MAVQLDLRLHCTDVAIHSMLGGQQWRRSERLKAAAEEDGEEDKRRRRSSRRRYRSSASDEVDDRVTRAGSSRDGSISTNDLPRRAGSGEQRRASAGRRLKLQLCSQCTRGAVNETKTTADIPASPWQKKPVDLILEALADALGVSAILSLIKICIGVGEKFAAPFSLPRFVAAR